MFSVASRLLRRDRSSARPASPIPPESLDKELGRLCKPPSASNDSKPKPVSESVIVRIQTILRHLDDAADSEWWARPRIYAILRTINGLQFMDAFVQEGWNDFFLPVHEADLPDFVRDEPGLPFREQFLAMQDYFMSPTRDIEKSSLQHFNLYDGDSVFQHIRQLGQGGFGYVGVLSSSEQSSAVLTPQPARWTAYGAP